MTSSELRISNWVEDENGYYQIESENLQDEVFPYLQTWEIPLTEEWHTKFGAQKKVFGSFEYALPRKNNIDIRVVFQGDYVFLRQSSSIRKSESQNPITDDVVSIWNKDLTGRDMHVHEWQNLYFALTGEELTFKQRER
jgi:hypothetical protein